MSGKYLNILNNQVLPSMEVSQAMKLVSTQTWRSLHALGCLSHYLYKLVVKNESNLSLMSSRGQLLSLHEQLLLYPDLQESHPPAHFVYDLSKVPSD